MNKIAACGPVSCAINAKENNLLDEPVQIRFKYLANREQKLIGLQIKLKLEAVELNQNINLGMRSLAIMITMILLAQIRIMVIINGLTA